jgi:hypothetical protein
LNDGADEYEVYEHAMPGRSGEVLVMLYLTDTDMFESPFEGRKFQSRDGESASSDRRPR